MKISRITVENCKSYRTRETITFDDRYNIFVGPNGGGKSNTLDIITILLRRFLLTEYITHQREENFSFFRDIEAASPFNEIKRFLEANLDRKADPVVISLSLVIGQSDLDNLATMTANHQAFRSARAMFRNAPYPHNLPVLEELSRLKLSVGSEVTFEIVDGKIQAETDMAKGVRKYLNSINFFLLLASEAGVTDLKPAFSYFSPYRAAGAQDLRANLSGDNFRAQLAAHANSSSHTSTSLLKLATLYFAELRRSLESKARSSGYDAEWAKDEVVQNVSRYLSTLGYGWGVEVIDANRNIYEIRLKRGEKEFSIEQASSGEKEILTFILGTFALRTSGGLILIDEPEVHLHPRWQATLRDLLKELANDTGNQIALSTHSPVFITPDTIGFVKRIFRGDDGSTKVVGREIPNAEVDPTNQWHMLNSHNNEKVFFADLVVLVEGIQDRILFDALLQGLASTSAFRGVIEVIEVHGKNNLIVYQRLLSELGVQHAVIADQDYTADIGPPALSALFSADFKAVNRKVLRNKKSGDRETLANMLELAIEESDIQKLKHFWEYVKGRHRQLRKNLTPAESQLLSDFLRQKKATGIYILSKGEIEHYLPIEARSLAGTIVITQRDKFLPWLLKTYSEPETSELLEIGLSIIGVEENKRKETIEKMMSAS